MCNALNFKAIFVFFYPCLEKETFFVIKGKRKNQENASEMRKLFLPSLNGECRL